MAPRTWLTAFARRPRRPHRTYSADLARRTDFATLAPRTGFAALALRTGWARRSIFPVEAVATGIAVEAVCAASVTHRDNGSIDLSETFGDGRAQLGDRRAPFSGYQLTITLPLALCVGEYFTQRFAESLSQSAFGLWQRRRGCFRVPVLHLLISSAEVTEALAAPVLAADAVRAVMR